MCHRYVSGLDDEAIASVAESVRLLRAEVDRRGPALKALPREVRPHGKLTRELASQRRLRLRPIAATFDEIQNAIMHPAYGAQIAEGLAYIERLGRKLGIFLILSTQRPDGDALPPKIRDLATVRFCLKVPDQVSNDMILGTGAYNSARLASRSKAPRARRGRGPRGLRTDRRPARRRSPGDRRCVAQHPRRCCGPATRRYLPELPNTAIGPAGRNTLTCPLRCCAAPPPGPRSRAPTAGPRRGPRPGNSHQEMTR